MEAIEYARIAATVAEESPGVLTSLQDVKEYEFPILTQDNNYTFEGYADSLFTWPPREIFYYVDSHVWAFRGVVDKQWPMIDNACFQWNTSRIDNYRKVGLAYLRVVVSSIPEDVDKDKYLCGDWYLFGTPGVEDYSETSLSNAVAPYPLHHFKRVGQVVYLPLRNLENINKAGYTGIRLHVGNDIRSATANGVSFASYAHPFYDEARLIVYHGIDPWGPPIVPDPSTTPYPSDELFPSDDLFPADGPDIGGGQTSGYTLDNATVTIDSTGITLAD